MTRARAFLRQMKIEPHTVILTSSKFADDPRVVGNVEIIKVDPDLSQNINRFRNFLKNTFSQRNCQKLYLDAFPFGISDELADFDFGEIELFYVARRLKLGFVEQFSTTNSNRFSKTFLLEPLAEKHMEFIKRNSLQIELLDLKYFEDFSETQILREKIIEKHSPYWLVVHSGNESETSELIDYAKEIHAAEKSETDLVLISSNSFEFENVYNIYPASALFPFAEKIFTACGFNSIKQTERFREKHYFLPFRRRFDDQFARAKIAREIMSQTPETKRIPKHDEVG